MTVDISIPKPLVERLNVHVGTYFSDELKHYVHHEELEDHGVYRIDIGASQVPVFAQVFDAMFDEVVPMVRKAPGETPADQDAVDEAVQNAPADEQAFHRVDAMARAVDGIVAPSIDEVQFAIPDQTGGDFYEVWIRYRMQLFDPDGNVLGEWPLIGYGKANQRNYGTMDQKETGLNEATISALRDAAALLSFQFRDQAEVRSWLDAMEDAR